MTIEHTIRNIHLSYVTHFTRSLRLRAREVYMWEWLCSLCATKSDAVMQQNSTKRRAQKTFWEYQFGQFLYRRSGI